MKKSILSITIFSITLMPLLTFAEPDFGPIGQNPGLDFYSRIDDAGYSLANAITRKRLTGYNTYSQLGCNLSSWIAGEKIDQNLLEQVSVGDYGLLIALAGSKKIQNLTTTQIAGITQCLSEKYRAIQLQSIKDQETYETVGNVGLYMDGDTANSDFDIVADIQKINTLIFKSQDKYTGTRNKNSNAIRNMIAGSPVAPLFGVPPKTNSTSPIIPPKPTNNNDNATSPVVDTLTPSSDMPAPWADMCTPSNSTNSTVIDGVQFDDQFISDLQGAINGGQIGDGYVAYTPKDTADGSNNSNDASIAPLTASSDFHNAHPCDGDIFCIKFGMVAGSQNLLGGSKNNSIETLLEKHTKMMDTISWSDLSQQKMTNNTYQLPFLNIKIASKIAGLRLYMHDAPQPTRTLKKEDTPQKKEDTFDASYKCAMNTVGLIGDEKIANGFGGAGFVYRRGATTADVQNMTTPLSPVPMENAGDCYQARMDQGRKEALKSFSTDLNEIQAFTQAMNRILLDILDADRKLDDLPIK